MKTAASYAQARQIVREGRSVPGMRYGINIAAVFDPPIRAIINLDSHRMLYLLDFLEKHDRKLPQVIQYGNVTMMGDPE